MKVITFEKRDEIKFPFGASCSMNSSCIEHGDQHPNIKIGYGVKLINCHITIHKSGSLEINDLCEIRGRIVVGEGASVQIGNGLVCNDSIFIHAEERSKIVIKDDCLFANPRIYNTDMHTIYDIETGKRINKPKDVLIGSRVWLARDTIILKGSNIGDGSVVGAGGIASGTFEGQSIIAGNPAKVIKKGISWSRSIEEEASKLLPPEFPASLFRSKALQQKHADVIKIGMPIWNGRESMRKSDYYAIYYLARALLVEKFKGTDIKEVEVEGVAVTLVDICDILVKCFDLSGEMNAGCGSCAYLAAKLLNHDELANSLYNKVRPMSDHIDNKLYSI